jgi:hypothetical protein
MASMDELFEIAKIPKGNNSMGSSNELYDEKKYYYEKVYPDGKLPWIDKPFDFINENPLYGKVNLNGDYIIPKSAHVDGELTYKRMTNLNDGAGQVLVFDFVAAAFKDLKANIKSLVRASWLSSGGPIADFVASKGVPDLGAISALQKKMHYFVFVSQFLSSGTPKHKEKISNISDFTNLFLTYLKGVASEIPFTKSGTISTYSTSPLATGLCVEIDTETYDNDEKKHKFLTDPNFNVYRIVARRFGFMIDRNVPWRLVADVKSLKMREYMRIAYEESIIQKRQNAIVEATEIAIKSEFPEWPTVEGIVDGTYEGANLEKATASPSEIAERQEQLEKELNDVLVDVANETFAAGLTETKELYNAKSPEWDINGAAICTGETFKVCRSRVLKFDKFFEIYYDIPYLDEIEEIKKTVYTWYLSYYVQNPITKKRILCSNKPGIAPKFTTKEIKLKLLSEQEYDKLYNEFFWIKMYFDIKLAESNIKLKLFEYNKHLKKIMELATLNFIDNTGKSKLKGTTTKNHDHTHKYFVDKYGNGTVAMSSVGPQSQWHDHKIINWAIQPVGRTGTSLGVVAGPLDHTHSINSDLPFALAYINKIIRKKMKGLKQIYRKEDKEQAIGELVLNASQNGMIPS